MEKYKKGFNNIYVVVVVIAIILGSIYFYLNSTSELTEEAGREYMTTNVQMCETLE